MVDIIDDVCKLTTIPYTVMKRLISKVSMCISHAVCESLLSGENITQVNVGIGKLFINVSDDSITYKFIPSPHLEELLVNTVNSGESPLVTKVEDTLKSKIINVYKDML